MKKRIRKMKSETERIMSDRKLMKRLLQARKEFEEGKGVKINTEDLWNLPFTITVNKKKGKRSFWRKTL